MEEEREFGLRKREGQGASSVTVSSGVPVVAKSGADCTNPTLQSTLLFLGKHLGDSSPLQTVVVKMPAHSTERTVPERRGSRARGKHRVGAEREVKFEQQRQDNF